MDRPLRIEVIDDATAAMFRRFTPAERFAMIDAMYRSARGIVLAGIRHRHPDWTEEQCQAEASRRIGGNAFARLLPRWNVGVERPLGIEVIDEQTAAHLRRMLRAERLRLAGELREDTRRRLALYLRSQHPDWTPRQVSDEPARRARLGRDDRRPD